MYLSLSPSLSLSLCLCLCLSLSLSLSPHIKQLTLTSLVGLLDFIDLGICTCTQDLNEAALIRSSSLHGPAEGLGIIEGLGLQQGKDTLLKVTTKLRLELLDQVL